MNRTIMHIDFDSFFASVEQQVNPVLRGKPIAVGGSSLTKGIVCAASIEAKKYGVKTGMPLFEAKRLCPQLISVKGDFTKYQHIHTKSLEIFTKFTDLVEPFSIDEAFLDVTKTLKLFESAENIAHKIKGLLYIEFGPYITASIGVGPNKLMAKLVSDLRKPNGLFRVTKFNLEEVLQSTELNDFCGIGTRISLRLNNLGIFTVRQLQNTPMEILYKEFGSECSKFLKRACFGIDNSPVSSIEYKPLPKSIGHQHTLAKNTKNIPTIKSNLRNLVEMTGRRLRKNQMVGKTVSIYLRDANREGWHKRNTMPSHTDNSAQIFETIEKIFDCSDWKKSLLPELRLVGITISNLLLKEQTSYPLLLSDQKTEKIILASDLINNKFGEFTLMPASTLVADQTKGKVSSFLKH